MESKAQQIRNPPEAIGSQWGSQAVKGIKSTIIVEISADPNNIIYRFPGLELITSWTMQRFF